MDYDTATPSTDLGFVLPTGPISKDLPPLSDSTDERTLSDLIRQKALVNVNVLSEILTMKAIQPAASGKLLVDALDANYKLSGLAAKNVAKELAGVVSITINIPQGEQNRQIKVDGPVIDVEPEPEDSK